MSVSPANFGLTEFTFPSAGSPPAEPTLSVNSAGTVATIIGSDTGTTNTVEVTPIGSVTGSGVWTTAGSRTGDGTVSLSLDPGRYVAIVTSSLDGLSSVSNVVVFLVGTDAETILEHSPADILRRVLISLGHGTTPSDNSSWPVYTAAEPNAPDNCITTYDTEGRFDGRNQNSGSKFEHYGVSVRVRGTTHPVGFAKARLLATALDEELYDEVVTIDGAVYKVHSASRTGPINPLQKEQGTRRNLFTINCVLALKRL